MGDRSVAAGMFVPAGGGRSGTSGNGQPRSGVHRVVGADLGPVPGARRRTAVESVRRCQLRLRLSTAELASVTSAATAEGRAAGAWVGQIAVRYARGEAEPLPVTWRDLLGELVRFRAELNGLLAAIDPDSAVENADDPGRRNAGELLCRVDEVIARARAADRPTPPARGGSGAGAER